MNIVEKMKSQIGEDPWHIFDHWELFKEATTEIETLQAQVANLEAANDAAEKSNNISDNGNMWRFWSDKARELAHKNVELSKALKDLQSFIDDAFEMHSNLNLDVDYIRSIKEPK